jgi:glycosyltransferase involved in cell wall biosynthesis
VNHLTTLDNTAEQKVPSGASPIAGKTIVCLATQAWNAHWTPVQQVMLRLAKTNRVVYVEPFHPFLSWLKHNQAVLRKDRSHNYPRLREVEPNLTVYRPSQGYLPFNMRSKIAAQVNSYLYQRELAKLMGSLGGDGIVLWAFFAQSLAVLKLPFDWVIYDCVDDWPSFFPDPREQAFVRSIDEQLCRSAHIVFVGSDPLLEKKRLFQPQTFVVNHAADTEHFAKAMDPATVIPHDLASIPGPRMGFVGMIDTIRFDAKLIWELAEQTAANIVIVGGCMEGAEKLLPPHPRIHWLGMRSVAELPSYLRGMDVLLMPYSINEATRTIYPLKLYEYLATGKPCVTTAIPAVEPLRHLMYVSDSHEQFITNADLALGEDCPSVVGPRVSYASTRTWEAHVARKCELLRTEMNNDIEG